MSIGDQAKDKAQEAGGKAKGIVGDLTGDHSMQAEGKLDEAAANVKQFGTKARSTAEDVVEDVSKAARKGDGVVNRLSRAGLRSEYAYVAGFASVAVSLGSWVISRNKTGDDKAQSDRWGIFIGHWAPTFFALGVALRLEED